jgi:hypothetical protein
MKLKYLLIYTMMNIVQCENASEQVSPKKSPGKITRILHRLFHTNHEKKNIEPGTVKVQTITKTTKVVKLEDEKPATPSESLIVKKPAAVKNTKKKEKKTEIKKTQLKKVEIKKTEEKKENPLETKKKDIQIAERIKKNKEELNKAVLEADVAAIRKKQQQKMEEEKKNLIQAQKKAELEAQLEREKTLKNERDRHKIEEERHKIEEEKRKIEAERRKMIEERRRIDEENSRKLEIEKQEIENEKIKLEEERVRVVKELEAEVLEKKRLEEEKTRLEQEKRKKTLAAAKKQTLGGSIYKYVIKPFGYTEIICGLVGFGISMLVGYSLMHSVIGGLFFFLVPALLMRVFKGIWKNDLNTFTFNILSFIVVVVLFSLLTDSTMPLMLTDLIAKLY